MHYVVSAFIGEISTSGDDKEDGSCSYLDHLIYIITFDL